jgi:hypothetical protein
MIGGDSAGGNLTSALLLHLGHPHPQIPEYQLARPLRGALLISPWISFDTETSSFKTNQFSDYLTSTATNRASEAFVGPGIKHDSYSEPINAPVEWWKEVAKKAVRDVLIWGGGGEVLIDGIRTFGEHIIEGFGMEDAERSNAKTAAHDADGTVEELSTETKVTEQPLVESDGSVKDTNRTANKPPTEATEVAGKPPAETEGAVKNPLKETNSTVEGVSTETKDFAEGVQAEADGTIKIVSEEANSAVPKAPETTNVATSATVPKKPSKPSEIKRNSRATLVVTPHEAHEEMIMDYILLISKKGDGAKEIENWMTKTLKE